jgi:hypothetical protein
MMRIFNLCSALSNGTVSSSALGQSDFFKLFTAHCVLAMIA